MWSALFCLASADNSLYLLYNILYFSYSVATSISSLHAFRHLLLCLACLLSWQLLFMHVSAACFFPRHRTFGASLYWSRWNVYLFSCSTHYMCSVECVIVEIRKVDFCTSICNIHVRTVYLSSVLSSSDNLTLQLSVTPKIRQCLMYNIRSWDTYKWVWLTHYPIADSVIQLLWYLYCNILCIVHYITHFLIHSCCWRAC